MLCESDDPSHSQLQVLFFLTIYRFSIFSYKDCNQFDFGIDHLVMTMCKTVSCAVGKGYPWSLGPVLREQPVLAGPPPPSAASANGCAHLPPGGQHPLPPMSPCPVPVPRGLFRGPVHHSQGRRLVHLSVSWATKQRCFFKKKFYIGGLLLYNVVLDSATQ